MSSLYAFAIAAIAATWVLLIPSPSNAADCCDSAGMCDDPTPGTDICQDAGFPLVILCQGGATVDEFYAYTDTAGDVCIYGTIDVGGGSEAGFCCDDSDLATLRKLVITADGGNDYIDLYDAATSSDWQEYSDLFGGSGNDVIHGSDYCASGRFDSIHGGSNNDYIYGRDGDDDLEGGSGTDFLWGDAGADLLRGDAGADKLYGGDGADYVAGGDGIDELHGNDGDDILCAMDDAPVDDTPINGGADSDDCYLDGTETSISCTDHVNTACPAP